MGDRIQTKKQLLLEIRRQTRPSKGFTQWVLVLEHRRLTSAIGLLVIEAQLDGKHEWSGSVSVNLPEKKKFGPDGEQIPSEWETLTPGQSRYNVFTMEMRGRSLIGMAKGFLKRSVEEGKIQDLLPW